MLRLLFPILICGLLIGCQTSGGTGVDSKPEITLWVLTNDNSLLAKPGMTGLEYVKQARICMDAVIGPASKQDLSDAMFEAVIKVGRKETFAKCMRSGGYKISVPSDDIVKRLPGGRTDTYYAETIDLLRIEGALDGVDAWPALLKNGDVDDLRSYLDRFGSTVYVKAAEIRYEVLKP